MKKTIAYLIVLSVFLLAGSSLSARDRKDKELISHTALYKGEKVAGLDILFANFDSNNTEFLLLANNVGASGNVFRVHPFFFYAYKDNAAAGLRLNFSTARVNLDNVDLNLLSPDLNFSFSGAYGTWRAVGGEVFHRNYIGLDRKGTVGIFCEFALGYNYNKLDFGAGNYDIINQVKLVFRPGLILYILPQVSVEASLGLADVSYTFSDAYSANQKVGSFGKWGLGARFNILNCNFGIAYHF